MNRFKVLKSSVQTTWGATKATIKGQLMSDDERRWESTDPRHIGLSQGPPLCRNCIETICRSQDLGRQNPDTIIAHTFARLRASAKLGCYLCSVLLDAEWTVDLTSESKAVVTRKLTDMNPPPNFFVCKITESTEHVEDIFVLDASANTWAEIEQKFTQYWKLNDILLLPKEGQLYSPSPWIFC
jgi:hypothetical protein